MQLAQFWSPRAVRLLGAALVVLGLLSIWLIEPARLATAFGLVSAGLAFAMQRVITSIADYSVILRSNSFTAGDCIAIGDVRKDVMAPGFIQTTIMEVGQPPSVSEPSGPWVRNRQFAGRIVTVSNAKIFNEPVYNYPRDFSFVWLEIAIPIPYQADRTKAYGVLLSAARGHAFANKVLRTENEALKRRSGVEPIDCNPPSTSPASEPLSATSGRRDRFNWRILFSRAHVGSCRRTPQTSPPRS